MPGCLLTLTATRSGRGFTHTHTHILSIPPEMPQWAPHNCCCHFFDIEGLEQVQRRSKLGKRDGEEHLRDLEAFSMEKRLRRDLTAFYGSLSEHWNEMRVGLSSQGTSAGISGNGLKLYQGKFKLDMRNNSFATRVVRH